MHDQEKGYNEIKRGAVEKLKEAVTLLLMEKNNEGYTKLYMLMNDEDIKELCRWDNDLFIVMKMVALWDEEKNAGRENNIFDHISTLDDARELYKYIVFSIYRLEQGLPLIYQDEAVQYLLGMNISPMALCGIALDKVIDGHIFYKNLSESLDRNGDFALGSEIKSYREQKELEGYNE